MQIKGLRIYVIVTAIVVTLAVLLTIQFVYQRYNVEQPLFKLYSQTKLVKDARIEQNGTSVKVILDVKKTDNLQKAYRELLSYTGKVMGNTKFSIELKDSRSKDLDDAFYQSQFVIYEAMAKGDFTKMSDVIQQNAEKAGATARVFIDNENIYVEFIKGKNYLYEVIPRKPEVNAEIADGTGSEQR